MSGVATCEWVTWPWGGWRPCVSRLLSKCGPTAIVRRVWAIVVDAVNGVLRRRLRSHVGQESLEGVAPTVTDSDATPAIVLKSRRVRIQATSFHGFPCSMFWSACQAVNLVGFGCTLLLVAAAACVFTNAQVVTLSDRRIAAVAGTQPPQLVSASTKAFNDNESSEPFSGEINKSWHKPIITP